MPLQTTERERERALPFFGKSQIPEIKREQLYREQPPSVAGIYTFLDFETPQQEAEVESGHLTI